ncbi:MAG: two pore domain potassium channel family protein [Symploca sp. SIO2G7]|nr:two pore domain potassium channel family protein [Symploca sp. SIO2G7]
MKVGRKFVAVKGTTLTTLGYGDSVSLGEAAQVLTNLEAIVGQLYSSILIAILICRCLATQSAAIAPQLA